MYLGHMLLIGKWDQMSLSELVVIRSPWHLLKAQVRLLSSQVARWSLLGNVRGRGCLCGWEFAHSGCHVCLPLKSLHAYLSGA